jgi:hypothetical protein
MQIKTTFRAHVLPYLQQLSIRKQINKNTKSVDEVPWKKETIGGKVNLSNQFGTCFDVSSKIKNKAKFSAIQLSIYPKNQRQLTKCPCLSLHYSRKSRYRISLGVYQDKNGKKKR